MDAKVWDRPINRQPSPGPRINNMWDRSIGPSRSPSHEGRRHPSRPRRVVDDLDDLDGDENEIGAVQLYALDEGDDGVSSDEEKEGETVSWTMRERIESVNEVDTAKVTVFCTCERFDKVKLPELLTEQLRRPFKWSRGQETIYVPEPPMPNTWSYASSSLPRPGKDVHDNSSLDEPLLPKKVEDTGQHHANSTKSIQDSCLIFFSYGVVVMWGLAPDVKAHVLNTIIRQVEQQPLPKRFVQEEELLVRYSDGTKAIIQNDTIILPRGSFGHVGVRLAIAHALAQSTKMCAFEDCGRELVQSTAHLPRELAKHGSVSLSASELSKLIGKLYVHRNDVNLLSGVLDMPEYFWQASDSVQELYKAVGGYLEMNDRIEAVNNRLEGTQNMLDMLQSRQEIKHGQRLEWIVIILVALEGLVGLLEFCGTIGLIPQVGDNSVPFSLPHLLTTMYFGRPEPEPTPPLLFV